MTTAATGFIGLMFLAGATVLGWFALEGVNRRPTLGALAMFAWVAVLVLFTDEDIFVQNFGGINVALPDVLCAFLAAIAVLRFMRRLPVVAPGLVLSLGVFAAMLAISYIRGLESFGLKRSTNEFREFFYFLTALAFALSFSTDKLKSSRPCAFL